jgi:IS605 OrfB family transposase
LKKLQRRVSRKVKGSNNRRKAGFKIARLHAGISDTRRDTLQKFTTRIIRENQAIYVEGLNVAGMVQNHNLAKHIADAAFGEIFGELEYKAKWYGRTYLPLDRYFPSSKLYSSCGHVLEELPLSVREWDCPGCGAHHDRDINAAINIKKAGQYLLKWQKATGSGARKVTPTRYQRRRSGVGIPRHNAKRLAAGESQKTHTAINEGEDCDESYLSNHRQTTCRACARHGRLRRERGVVL